MFINNTPVMVYLQGSAEVFKVAYDEVIKTNYGVCATKTITSSAGTTIEVKDCYYFASQKAYKKANEFAEKALKLLKTSPNSDLEKRAKNIIAICNRNK